MFEPFRHIHDMGLWHPEEDQFVMRGAFLTQQWALDIPLSHKLDIFNLDKMKPEKRARWMRHYKECVKRQLVFRGGERIHLSKNPIMSGWVESILEYFPDARIVVMVRNPDQCIPSTLKMLKTFWVENGWRKVDYEAPMQAVLETSYGCFDNPHRVLSEKPAVPHIFVDYRDLTTDPRKTISNICSSLDIPVTSEFDNFLKENQAKERNHSTHFSYSLEEFELSKAILRERLPYFYSKYQWDAPASQALDAKVETL
jgi:hypothetical protein